MNKKYVEELNITTPGFVIVENSLNMLFFDDSVRVVMKLPNKNLYVRSFFDYEKAIDFITEYINKKENREIFNNYRFSDIQFLTMDNLDTEYRVVDKDKCVSFSPKRIKTSRYTEIETQKLTSYDSASIKIKYGDFKKFYGK